MAEPKYGELQLFSCPVCCERRWVKYHPQRKYHDEECVKRAKARIARGEPIADSIQVVSSSGKLCRVYKVQPKRTPVPSWFDAEVTEREIRRLAAERNAED